MANRDCQAITISKLLNTILPQSIPTPVTTAAVCGNHEFAGARIAMSPQHTPPTINALHSKLSRVVTNPYVHKTLVLNLVVNTIRIGPSLGQ